jgi:hypothetical protein
MGTLLDNMGGGAHIPGSLGESVEESSGDGCLSM